MSVREDAVLTLAREVAFAKDRLRYHSVAVATLVRQLKEAEKELEGHRLHVEACQNDLLAAAAEMTH